MSGTGAYSFIRWSFVDRVARKKFIWIALRRFGFEFGQGGDAFATPAEQEGRVGFAKHDAVSRPAKLGQLAAPGFVQCAGRVSRQQLIVARDLRGGEFLTQVLLQLFIRQRFQAGQIVSKRLWHVFEEGGQADLQRVGNHLIHWPARDLGHAA